MTFLPVVARELVVKARQPATYRTRAGAAAVMVAMFTLVLIASSGSSQQVVGHRLLNSCGMLALGFTMVWGLFLTADCISSEKRDGTIGLLFLTDLKSYDVLLGKLAGSSLNAFFGLLAVFPVLALPILVGGVTGSEFVRLLLAFAVTAFFSLSIGLLASVINREAKDALTAAVVTMFVFALFMPAAWWLIALGAQSGRGVPADNAWNFLLWPCPVYTYLKAFASDYRTSNGAAAFWSSIWTLMGISFLCLIVAGWLLPRVWHLGDAPVLNLRARIRFLFPKSSRTSRLIGERNPIFCLCMHDTRTRWQVRRTLIIFLPLWFGFTYLSVTRKTSNQELFTVGFFTAYAMHLVTKIFIALEASRRFSEDRQSGALELLLVTPIKIREILKGQVAAVKRQFRGVLVVLCSVNALMMFCVVVFSTKLHTNDSEAMWGFGTIFFGGIFALMLDFPALTWLAMWRGLKSRKHHNAVIATILQVLAPGWLAVLLLVLTEPRIHRFEVIVVFGSWFALGAVVSVMTMVAARRKITSRFRTIATSRF